MTKPLVPFLADQSGVLARLDDLVDRSGGPDACWPYIGNSLVRGYPVLWVRLQAGGRRLVKLSRLVAELVNGEVDETVDHTCHDAATCPGGETDPHRRCLNPAHLAAESTAENARRNRLGMRQEVCGEGHPLVVTGGGRRYCRTCAATRARERRAATPRRQSTRRPQQETTTRGTPRQYRPRGLTEAQMVDWGLEGQVGDGCWSWRGQAGGKDGYVHLHINRDGHKTTVDAHRLVHEVRNGPIPAGAHVDHTCHRPDNCPGGGACLHRACCNPAHLAAVSAAQNNAVDRRVGPADLCREGHDLTGAYVDKRGSRHCRECGNRRQTAARAAAREGREDQRFRVDGQCRAGRHRIGEVGETSEGRCAGCAREAKARYKERQRAT